MESRRDTISALVSFTGTDLFGIGLLLGSQRRVRPRHRRAAGESCKHSSIRRRIYIAR